MVSPPKVVKFDFMVVEILRKIAQTGTLVNAITTVRMLSWFLQTVY